MKKLRIGKKALWMGVWGFVFLGAPLLSSMQTIEEKKQELLASQEEGALEGEKGLKELNKELQVWRGQLEECYRELATSSSQEQHQALLERVQTSKAQIISLEEAWRKRVVSQAKREEEGYAFWDEEQTDLAHLVMEYGSADFLYLIPPEIASLKIHLSSSIPIPRESWQEMLEMILVHNGIGLKPLNPYAKQLFFLKQEPMAVQAIFSNREHVKKVASTARICYVFAPPIEEVPSALRFLEKFSDSKQTVWHTLGSRIALIGMKPEVERLLTVYEALSEGQGSKTGKVISVTKMHASEMEKILSLFFEEGEKGVSLQVFPLVERNALLLLGSLEMVSRAEKIMQEMQSQLEDPHEMTLFFYPCRHSDPSDLAKVLGRVYYSLLSRGGGVPLQEGGKEEGTEHFIPDPKTGSLLMVVRREALERIQELLRKLDVPKKMVQIEVLLFEKRVRQENNVGINLLRLHSSHSQVRYETGILPQGKGILEFVCHRNKTRHFPEFDLAYSFILSQEDVQLNAAPSVITVNQTPATISIVEEISINNGAAPIDTNKGIAFEKSFTRAQYGITIVLTPTVHLCEEEEEGKGSITLRTDITFDTNKTGLDDRPLIDKRHIENEVRVFDGQTIILGGLRRNASDNRNEKVPFLGEIPGLGKLFGSSRRSDNNTEMFFFITPRIILEPKQELLTLRREELTKRPGDIPEFLERLVEARREEKQKLFAQSLKLLTDNH
eukprot:Opistho-1_new@93849